MRYSDEHLNYVALPLGGMGAGMVALEGVGSFNHVSIEHRPDLFHGPMLFGALRWDDGEKSGARVLEGPVPDWKVGALREGKPAGAHYGLPRFRRAEAVGEFPFLEIELEDPDVPVETRVTGWSPFAPGDADASSLPVGAVEYRFANPTNRELRLTFSFHMEQFLVRRGQEGGPVRIEKLDKGFLHRRPKRECEPWSAAAVGASIDEEGVTVDAGWFRGGWFDPLTMVWKKVESGRTDAVEPHEEGDPAPGSSLYFAFELQPGESRAVPLRLFWHVPCGRVRTGPKDLPNEGCCEDGSCEEKPAAREEDYYRPWYASQFSSAEEVNAYWSDNYERLREASQLFRETFYSSTLPPEVVDAAASNLAILKSPTVLRQFDGRFWAWEGSGENAGCCQGTCTHVWNYAQALPHLFPGMERSIRESEFFFSQDEAGHQNFRTPMPIRAADHDFHVAADGQLGGFIKAYRDWRICGDREWLAKLWPKLVDSLSYCMERFDPERKGALIEPHHNTYDIEFWGANGMCTSFYCGALVAMREMGEALGEDVSLYREMADKSDAYLKEQLFNGEYFIQKTQWKGLRAGDPVEMKSIHGGYSAEARAILEKEGPKYQYGNGCLSDGVLGFWLAWAAGLDAAPSGKEVRSHLQAVYRYNFKESLQGHANPQRWRFAVADEGGLLLCSWPKGDEPSLPFVYSNEVWTGIEYQVASHLISVGLVEEGLEIVKAARRRYDGKRRNPFDEIECGHWYARAMASYALLQACSGARYDAVEKTLYVDPKVEGGFVSFLSTAGGYGLVGVRDGKPFYEVKCGEMEVDLIVYRGEEVR